MEAFTDAVIAIIMTILVLELQPPEGGTWTDLWQEASKFGVYVLSFLILSIYWINHHHLLQVATEVSNKVLWLNILFILCLSMIPFTTAWIGDQVGETQTAPELTYGIVMFAADVIWFFLALMLNKANGNGSGVVKATQKSSWKSWFTLSIIIVGIVVGIWVPYATLTACLVSLVPWLFLDQHLKKQLYQ
jgi:uncharacterized membrane protein